MGTDTDRLIVTWEARLRDFEREMRRGQTVARTNFRRMETEARAFEQRFATAGRRAGQAFNRGVALLGAGLGVAGLTRSLNRARQLADDIVNVADRVGVTTGQLQEFHFAAIQADVAVGDFDDSLDAFAKRLGDAAKGTGELLKVLEANNVPLRDQEGNLIGVADQLLRYADLMENASDEVTRAALSNAAFGRGNVEMQALLSAGSRGLRQQGDEARRLGGILGDQLLRRTAELNDKWDAFTTVAGSQFNGLLLDLATSALDADGSIEGLLEKTKDLFEYVRENMPTISAWAQIMGGISLGAKVGGLPGAAVGGLAATGNVLRRQTMLTQTDVSDLQRDLDAFALDRQALAEAIQSNIAAGRGDAPIVRGLTSSLAELDDLIGALQARINELTGGPNMGRFNDAFAPNASSAANPIRARQPDMARFPDAFGGPALVNDGPLAVSAPVTRLPGETDLSNFLAVGKDLDHVARLQSDFADALAQMLDAAPESVRAATTINSGFRTFQRQAELYAEAIARFGRADLPGHQVARPGTSQHEAGNAADLGFGTAEAREWFHANAAQFGLGFPVPGENWHIQGMAGTREQADTDFRTQWEQNQQLRESVDGIFVALQRETGAIDAETAAMGRSIFERERARAVMEIENQLRDAGVTNIEEYRAQIDELADSYARATEQAALAADSAAAMAQAAAEAGELLGGAMKGFISDLIAGKSASEALGNALARIGEKLLDAGIDMIFANLFSPTTGGGFLGSLFGGARAMGGPVNPGRAYLVGERGPELFAPRMAGVIVPNRGQGASQQPIVVQLDVAANDYFDARVGQISAGTARVVVNKETTRQREMQRRRG